MSREPCRRCGGPKPPGRGRIYCSAVCVNGARKEHTRRAYHERKAKLAKFKLFYGCQRCGYRDHPAALDFHHTDPASKEFSIARNRMRASRVRLELAKCVVLCANCHRELHARGEL